MKHEKIFTYVSPKSNNSAAQQVCSQLPIVLRPVPSMDKLFPLISNSRYCTDFVAVSLEQIHSPQQQMDMFGMLLTLNTLLTSAARASDRPAAKILVLVDEDSPHRLIKDAMAHPSIHAVALVLKREEDIPHHVEYVQKLISGEWTHDPWVIDMIKPIKKLSVSPNKIKLTPRQSQILRLIQERGCSNKHIAKLLNLSESTVKLHVSAVLKKYRVKNRTQLAMMAYCSE